MATPPQVNVLYRFAPATKTDWATEEVDGWETASSSIADAFVFTYSYVDDCNAYAYLTQSATQQGYVIRGRCNFSISALPVDTGSFFGLDFEPQIILDPDGHLGFRYFPDMSVQALAPGTTYALEWYVKGATSDPSYMLWQIYIDGELWLELDPEYGGWSYYAAEELLFYAGFGAGLFCGTGSTVVSMTDVVWTMEDDQVGSGVWTMLALL
jgi:hypothetical protein